MNNWKNATRLPVYIGIAAILSACGASSSTSFGTALSGVSSNTSGGGTIITPTPTPSPTTSSTLSPALSFANFAMSGPGGKNPTYSTGDTIATDDTLKVQVQAMPGTALLESPSGQYSGFSANYHCISYQVSVYDSTGAMIGSQTTQLLAADTQNSICTGNPNTQILDFSGSVANGSHGLLNVEVQPLAYDWYCQLWYEQYDIYGVYSPYYQYYSYWCPSKAVYANHQVNASIQVEVDGTQFN